jgi:hypothetical protein
VSFCRDYQKNPHRGSSGLPPSSDQAGPARTPDSLAADSQAKFANRCCPSLPSPLSITLARVSVVVLVHLPIILLAFSAVPENPDELFGFDAVLLGFLVIEPPQK